jgi:hypothetical protein
MGTDHTAQNGQDLNRDEVKELYDALWGTSPPLRLNSPTSGPDFCPDTFLNAITPDEVRRRVRRTKRSTAPGPDDVRRAHVVGVHKYKLLAGLYNVIVLAGSQPTEWHTNRTILIPKEGKDGAKVANYRPITISSLLSRLFWGIVDHRLRKIIKMNPRQKGFVAEAGCFANVQLLDELVRTMKRSGGGVGIQLDISKAFDTVPHKAIEYALTRKGLPPAFVKLVSSSYHGVRTNIEHPKGAIPITLKRGVKQGDPLSPLLFNLVLEPLLDQLNQMEGVPFGDESISVIAFADDLFLFASDALKAQSLLDCTVDYLGAHGMTLSASKSRAFEIKYSHKSWSIVDPQVERLGERIPVARADECLTYLGVKYSLWKGIDLTEMGEHLTSVLRRVKRLRLKPTQKLHLLQTYLVPHYLHQLVIAAPALTALKAIDQEVRVAIKEFMHLPQSISDGIIYCRKGDGGLGFPKLEQLVPRVSLEAGLRLGKSPDPALQALSFESWMTARLRRLANSIRVNYPYTWGDLQRYKARCRKEELDRWGEQLAQGGSVTSFTDDKIGNAFLYEPHLLKPCRFITALQLRTNTGGNRSSLNRAVPQRSLLCRKCHLHKETLAHILGNCIHTKGPRIKRHNEIRDLIESSLQEMEAVEVTKEPDLTLPTGEKLKPDLVIKNREGVFVVDVTVRHEDGDYLARARDEKIDKYRDLLPQLQESSELRSEVLPIVVGTRGAMPPDTVRCLEALNLKTKARLKTISLIALRSSLEIYHAFLDYDGTLPQDAPQLIGPRPHRGDGRRGFML